jgi:hypothetical protein
MWVHHEVEKQVINTKWPGLFTHEQLESLDNLRGIPNDINRDIHLSQIRVLWNDFYRTIPVGTTPDPQAILNKAKEIDDHFGHLFLPPVR